MRITDEYLFRIYPSFINPTEQSSDIERSRIQITTDNKTEKVIEIKGDEDI